MAMKHRGPEMREEAINVAVIGLGKLGRACADALRRTDGVQPAGVVRRPETAGERLPAGLAALRSVPHIAELGKVDAALVCVPTEEVLPVVRDLLQHRIPVVECATLHGEELEGHRAEIDRLSIRFETPAVVGAGWDPGALGLIRALFSLLVPGGRTEASWRTGGALHHVPLAAPLRGVRRGMSTELRDAEGRPQRYLYVELEKGARIEEVEKGAKGDPLFLGVETVVVPVDDLSELEEEGHGVLLERKGSGVAHAALLLEARYAEPSLTAQVMVAAAKAVHLLRHGGARTLFDIPLRLLLNDPLRFL
jgi:diaminopimelate dehydrogenase